MTARSPRLDSRSFDSLLRFVAERTGLRFPEARRESAAAGVRRAMERAGFDCLDGFEDFVRTRPDQFDDLVGELTVGETYFFREPAQMEFIRREVLADVRRGPHGRTGLHAWSAGCASGEEPYTLAMLLAGEDALACSRILATDISPTALERARRAEYREWSLRGGPGNPARTFLSRRGSNYVLDERIRRAVKFDRLNLADDDYPSVQTGTSGLDLVLCRNVLIYFDRETITGVAGRLYESLRPGGWLITAASDPSLAELAPFELVQTEAGVVYRRPDRDEAPAVPDTEIELVRRVGTAPFVESILKPSSRVDAEIDRKSSDDREDLRIEAMVAEARTALTRGEYDRVLETAREFLDRPDCCALVVRATAGRSTREAVERCGEFAAKHKTDPELHYLHAVLLLDVGEYDAAVEAARRIVYLDNTLEVGHFTLGLSLERSGYPTEAARSFRNAHRICAGRPHDAVVPLSDGETAGCMVEALARRLPSKESTGAVEI